MTEFDAELDKLLNDGAGTVYITFKTKKVMVKDIPDGELTVKIGKKIKRRSLNANAYFHLLVGKIARALDISESEAKNQTVLDYGEQAAVIALPCDVKPSTAGIAYSKWLNDFISPKGVKCSQYAVYKPTHELNSAEMARLIDGVVFEAKQLGIETKTPAEIAEMKALWETQKE